MKTREMVKKLEAAGFEFVRSKKHSLWRRGDVFVTLPNGNHIESRLAKLILVQIKRALEGRGNIRYA